MNEAAAFRSKIRSAAAVRGRERQVMRRIPLILRWTALMLSHAMCACVAWEYCSLLWTGRYAGASAPAYIALFLAIPFLIGIAACLTAAHFFQKRDSSAKQGRT